MRYRLTVEFETPASLSLFEMTSDKPSAVEVVMLEEAIEDMVDAVETESDGLTASLVLLPI